MLNILHGLTQRNLHDVHTVHLSLPCDCYNKQTNQQTNIIALYNIGRLVRIVEALRAPQHIVDNPCFLERSITNFPTAP
jgi:hypothetical protein